MKPVANFTEYYLRYPERRGKLTNEQLRLFWSSRFWHPVVRMAWVAEIVSSGEGMLTYPDGTKHFYGNGTSL